MILLFHYTSHEVVSVAVDHRGRCRGHGLTASSYDYRQWAHTHRPLQDTARFVAGVIHTGFTRASVSSVTCAKQSRHVVTVLVAGTSGLDVNASPLSLCYTANCDVSGVCRSPPRLLTPTLACMCCIDEAEFVCERLCFLSYICCSQGGISSFLTLLCLHFPSNWLTSTIWR